MGKGAFPEDHPLFAGHGRHPDPDAVGQRGVPGERPRARRRRPVRRPAHRRPGDLPRAGAGSSTSTSSRPRSARSSSPTWASSAHAKPTPAAAARRARKAARRRSTRPDDWVERVTELRGTLLRRDDFDDVPIKPPRVYREINESVRTRTPLRHRDRALPDLVRPVPADVPPAALPGLRAGRPARLGGPGRDRREVRLPGRSKWSAVVGDYSFQFLMEEIAVAAQYRIPFVIVMVNNEYLGLIRQAELGYDMNYAVGPALRRGRHRPRHAHGGDRAAGRG